jgi:hypothetical protein
MKIKVGEATGHVLDWMVCEANGSNAGELRTYEGNGRKWIVTEGGFTVDYTTNWAQGGPIIEKERLLLQPSGLSWECSMGGTNWFKGHTPLIAAMRCYVVSKLGNELEVPKELA